MSPAVSAAVGPAVGAVDGVLAAWVGLLGLAIGSFLNVVVWRVPRGESVVSPPSACPGCGHAIRARDNVPVLGWVLLRGRCRDCAAPISARYPLVEAGTGLLFVLVALRFGVDGVALLPAYLFFAALGVSLALIDLDVRRLPDALVLPAYPVVGALLVLAALVEGDPGSLVRAATGAAVLGGFYALVWFLAPGGMGFGDVKLAPVVGAVLAYLSWGALLAGALLAFVLGAAVGVVVLARVRGGDARRLAVPFGPFMVLGALASVLGASGLGEAYLRSLGV